MSADFPACLSGDLRCTGIKPCAPCARAVKVAAALALRELDGVMTSRVREELARQGVDFRGFLLSEQDVVAYLAHFDRLVGELAETADRALTEVQKRLAQEDPGAT